MQIWRMPYADENRVISEWGKITYKEKIKHILTSGMVWVFAMLLVSIDLNFMTVRGRIRHSDGLILGCIAALVIIFICAMMILGSHKKLKMLEQCEYSISEARVIDKRTHTGRPYTKKNGKFLKVRFPDGKEDEYSIGTYTYELASLETKLIVIQYNDDISGFYDQYDFVPIKK